MRARDSRGRPVRGIYIRDSRFFAGWSDHGRWSMKQLDATTLTEARNERESLLAGLREGRVAARNGTSFGALFQVWQEGRAIGERTKAHEQHLLDRHLEDLVERRVQDMTRRDLNRILREMKERYSPWTCVAVHRIMVGIFALAVRDDIITRSPADRLSPSERPRQRNQKQIALLDSATMTKLIGGGGSERWRAAIALAGVAGLRIGEVRGLRWSDVDFDADTISVARSLLPDGQVKETKTAAGRRTIALFPELRRAIRHWQIKSPWSDPGHYVVCTATGDPVQERNLRRALDAAKAAAGIDGDEKRLSWHSLRHSVGSIWLTEYGIPIPTVAAMMGHSTPAFTLACYGRDPRDEQTIVADVLMRAAEANGA